MTAYESDKVYFQIVDMFLATGIRPRNAGLGGRSKYFKFYTADGRWISIRVGDHYANEKNNILADEYYEVNNIEDAEAIISRIEIIDTGIPSEFGGNYKEYRFN